ncbi:MAG: enoyl-CoA hydratase-related protein [Thermoplasmata archaeon]|nr:enoyl-CoA hydratase-related protein [Thermoplasmata archaeon]
MAATPPGPLVRYDRDEAVVLLGIDHPPVNVLSAGVLDALQSALTRVAEDPEVRAVVLYGLAERSFAAGANIREMAPMGSTEARVHGARGQATTVAIERLPLPVIAAVHGSCLGGGTELALACDFILASDDALFGQPEINLGVMPGWGGTRRLPRRIGAALARRWILTGKPVSARDAFDQGLLERIVPRSELMPAARALAHDLAHKAPVALAAAKFSLNHALDPAEAEGLEYELDLWARLFDTLDQKEGMRAFLEKRAWTSGNRAEWGRRSVGFPWAVGSGTESGSKAE